MHPAFVRFFCGGALAEERAARGRPRHEEDAPEWRPVV